MTIGSELGKLYNIKTKILYKLIFIIANKN